MGLEPTTYGTTIRRSNQLSYIHHVKVIRLRLIPKTPTLKVLGLALIIRSLYTIGAIFECQLHCKIKDKF